MGHSALPNSAPRTRIRLGNFLWVLTSAKTLDYCHSQPPQSQSSTAFDSSNPVVANESFDRQLHEIKQRWVIDRDSAGENRARAHLKMPVFSDGVIVASLLCAILSNLGLPGYYPLVLDGANINLGIGDEVLDQVSGGGPTSFASRHTFEGLLNSS